MASGMTMTALNGVKVYNLSAGKKLPEWLPEAKRRSLVKEDEGYARRVQLLQDFDFTTASQDIKISSDGMYIAACGVYPPQVKVFDVQELGMKFERHMDAEVVAFDVLSEDWSKMVFLQVDRTLEFHAAYGRHYRTRVPRFGRCMAYYRPSAELYVAGAGNEIFRLNMEEGRFMAPFESKSDGINAAKVCPTSGLLATGGESGIVEMWDPRTRTAAGSITLTGTDGGPSAATALTFDGTGLGMAAGTEDGNVFVYDLRSSKPVTHKRHQYGEAIKDVCFHRGAQGAGEGGLSGAAGSSTASGSGSSHVISADSKIIKIWNRHSGRIFTNIETPAPISRLCLVPEGSGVVGGGPASTRDSGLILASGEQSRMQSYYVPSLGVAPRWCAFLDALTEEMEEGPSGAGDARVYDDYKFITRDELLKLGMGHLVGSSLLRPYMHGFFMDMKLYSKVQAALDPFAYEQWRKDKIKAKLEAKAESRIAPRAKKVVNADLAERLSKTGNAAAGDSRFGAMFANPDFQVDTKSAEFQAHLEAAGSKAQWTAVARGKRADAGAGHSYHPEEGDEGGARGAQDVDSEDEMLQQAGLLHAEEEDGGVDSDEEGARGSKRRAVSMYTLGGGDPSSSLVAKGGSATHATLLLGSKSRLRQKMGEVSEAAAARAAPLAARLGDVAQELESRDRVRSSTRGTVGGGREAAFRAGGGRMSRGGGGGRGRGRGRGGSSSEGVASALVALIGLLIAAASTTSPLFSTYFYDTGDNELSIPGYIITGTFGFGFGPSLSCAFFKGNIEEYGGNFQDLTCRQAGACFETSDVAQQTGSAAVYQAFLATFVVGCIALILSTCAVSCCVVSAFNPDQTPLFPGPIDQYLSYGSHYAESTCMASLPVISAVTLALGFAVGWSRVPHAIVHNGVGAVCTAFKQLQLDGKKPVSAGLTQSCNVESNVLVEHLVEGVCEAMNGAEAADYEFHMDLDIIGKPIFTVSIVLVALAVFSTLYQLIAYIRLKSARNAAREPGALDHAQYSLINANL